MNGEVLASGTNSNWETARQIAIAETLERIAVQSLTGQEAIRVGLVKVPSTSGFAAGFAEDSTKLRALSEGLERWIWSQWIDRGYVIEEQPTESIQLSPLAEILARDFDRVRFYKKNFYLPGINTHFQFGATLAIRGAGVFAGSRVTLAGQDIWTHGLVEAHRNLSNFKILSAESLKEDDWFMRRVTYFGMNAQRAWDTIAKTKKTDWPAPRLEIFSSVPISENLFCLWRCLFSDFIPWHEGPVDRFVY
jgi:hypothetical protein